MTNHGGERPIPLVSSPLGRPQDRADAQLIAAAPELLEALRSAMMRMRHLHNLRLEGEPKPLDFSDDIKSGYAAIAKAEGR